MYRPLFVLTAAAIEYGDCISKDVGVEIFVVFRYGVLTIPYAAFVVIVEALMVFARVWKEMTAFVLTYPFTASI